MKSDGKKRMDRSDVFLFQNTNYETLKEKKNQSYYFKIQIQPISI